MILIIVESPTKAKTISKFLDKSYNVDSSYGHIRDLPKSKLGVDIENNFAPHYVIPTKARQRVTLLKKEAQKAEKVILATDEDREGEAIAWHLVQTLGLNEIKKPALGRDKSRLVPTLSKKPNSKHYERIVFHEITKNAILEALKNPRLIDINLVDAQQARRILDRLVGYKLSPFLWHKIRRGLSAGRVQSPALRLIVEREREIQNFVPQEYWTIVAKLLKIKNQKSSFDKASTVSSLRVRASESRTAEPLRMTLSEACGEYVEPVEVSKIKNNEFEAILVKKDGQAIGKFGIKSKKETGEIIKDLEGAEYKVKNIERKESKRYPLPPFTTSTLQQEAAKRFHFSAKLTMKIAQQLYETGWITYHRTDSLNLSESSLIGAKQFIIANFGQNYWAGSLKKYKAKGRVQEAHEAIRPTYPEKESEKLKNETKLEDIQAKLYDLIWRRFIACQMAEARFDSTVVEIEAGNSPATSHESRAPEEQAYGASNNKQLTANSHNKYTFRATGQILKFDGFLKVYPLKFEEVELPPLEKEEILELMKLIPSQHFTQPPSRYSEASLIKALESFGIGRPSTYAPIISTIQERGYVEKKEDKKFHPTEIGFLVNDLLVKHFSKVVDIKFTAELEEDLDKIAGGNQRWIEVLKNFYVPFEENIQRKEKEISKKDLTEEKTNLKCPKCKGGLVIKMGRFGKFFACSKWPNCDYTQPIGEEKELNEKFENEVCSICGAPMKVKRGKFGLFLGCSRYPECRNIKKIEKSTGVKCPECGRGEIIEKKTKKGRIFYSCNRWPNCKYASWKKPTVEYQK